MLVRRFALLLIIATITPVALADDPLRASAIVLAGEPVRFTLDRKVVFSDKQVKSTSAATRAGLARWAATRGGWRVLQFLDANQGVIHVTEDFDQPGIGSAPQPGIATFAALRDPAKTKTYRLILNPTPLTIPEEMVPLPNEPATTDDLMTLAWAGEMLHIQFYAKGIQLPHHQRGDFHEAWLSIARELGFPAVTHSDGAHVEPGWPQGPVRVIGGTE